MGSRLCEAVGFGVLVEEGALSCVFLIFRIPPIYARFYHDEELCL